MSEWAKSDGERGLHPAFAEAARAEAAFKKLRAGKPRAFTVPAARGRWTVLVHRSTAGSGWQATTFEGNEPIMDRRAATWRSLLDTIRRDPIDWTKVKSARQCFKEADDTRGAEPYRGPE